MKTRFEFDRMSERKLLKYKSKLLTRRLKLLYQDGMFDSPTRQELNRIKEVIYSKQNPKDGGRL
jgi:hypothetical protein